MTFRKTLVIGANGFLGRAFYAAYQNLCPGSLGTHHRPQSDFQLFDLRQPHLNSLKWNPKEYSHVMICASISDMWKCERNEENSYYCNVLAHIDIVEQCACLGLTPILFSTDYVFDGKTAEYFEDSPLNPLNGYGSQKAELETTLLSRFPDRFLLIRLSKVLSFRPEDREALTQMVQRFIDRKQAGIVWDQIFCPILIDDVIQGVTALQALGSTGIFNLCGSEIWSRIAIYQAIAKALQLRSLSIPITTTPCDPLERPKRTVMSSKKFQRTTGLCFKKLSQHIEELSKVSVS